MQSNPCSQFTICNSHTNDEHHERNKLNANCELDDPILKQQQQQQQKKNNYVTCDAKINTLWLERERNKQKNNR